MAVPQSTLPEVFSRRSNDILRRSIFLEMYMNRSWESELQTNYKTNIPRMGETVTVTDMARDADWKTGEEVSVTDQEFAVDQSKETGIKIGRKDQLESQLNLVARQVDINAHAMAVAIQIDLFSVLRSGVKSTHQIAKSTTAAEYLTGAAKVADATVRDAIGARVEDLVLQAATVGWVGADAMVQQAPVALCHPYIIAASLNYFAAKEKLAEVQMVGDFSRAAVGASGMYAFHYRGVTFRGTTLADHFDDSDGDPLYPLLMFLPQRYMTYARRPTLSVMFTPDNNPDGPRYRLHQVSDYGRKILNDDAAYVSWIRQGA